MLSDTVTRRKRLLVRSRQRGLREVDLLLSSFAERYLAELSLQQLQRYEQLLEIADPILYDWISGQYIAPQPHAHDIMDMLVEFVNRYVS